MEAYLKQHIVEELQLQAGHSSQNRVALRIGISAATVSSMINNNWKLIKDEMWRKAMVNLKIDPYWKVVPTTNYTTLIASLDHCQAKSLSIGISEKAGIGKSQAFKDFARTRKHVIYIECKNYWSKKSFARNLCLAAGIDTHGTTEALIERFIDHLKGLQSPIIIFDQADKLKDPQLDLFMDFYNELLGNCAFVLSGVLALKKRILSGVQHDKMGYRELWSRIGAKFYDGIAKDVSLKDVTAICRANALEDPYHIESIYYVSEGDLRKVRREVEKMQLAGQKAA